MIAPRVHDNRPFLLALISLVALAWLALAVWEQSAYGRFLSHDAIEATGASLDLHYAGIAALFVAGWTLMVLAMMLPTVLPLLMLFRRLTFRRADSGRLILALVGGYLGVWVLFGALAHLGDLGLHAALRRTPGLEGYTWAIGGLLLVGAGAYQFTPLKYVCLDKCRSPFSFVMEHWHGRSPKVEALRLGLHHGLFCVDCCWSLMLLMFAVGVGSIVWMLLLAATMAIEKNVSWGHRLSTPLGILLVVAGATLLGLQGVDIVCAHDSGFC